VREDHACAENPGARVAGVHCGLEGPVCDAFVQLIELGKKRDRLIKAASTGVAYASAMPDGGADRLVSGASATPRHRVLAVTPKG
jgi:hypothetical protein